MIKDANCVYSINMLNEPHVRKYPKFTVKTPPEDFVTTYWEVGKEYAWWRQSARETVNWSLPRAKIKLSPCWGGLSRAYLLKLTTGSSLQKMKYLSLAHRSSRKWPPLMWQWTWRDIFPFTFFHSATTSSLCNLLYHPCSCKIPRPHTFLKSICKPDLRKHVIEEQKKV